MEQPNKALSSVRTKRIIGIWLMIGVLMIFFQIIIGGITRLTGSGLSITQWEIVLGTIPPLSENAWTAEFEKYRATPQYQQINKGMSLSEFKFIYWWEYLHRLWARLMGFVFAIPFFYFLWQKWLDRKLKLQLLTVVGLAAIVASFGWIMVASGLRELPWVNPYNLIAHLSLALITYGYLLWITLPFWLDKGPPKLQLKIPKLRTAIIILTTFVSFQIILGGAVSGMRAALFFPTFPLMHGSYIPPILLDWEQWQLQNLIHWHEGTFAVAFMQFFHRNLGYLITLFVVGLIWYIFKKAEDKKLRTLSLILIAVTFTQVLLGVITLLTSKVTIPVSWGVAHQGVAVVLLSVCLLMLYYIPSKKSIQSSVSK